MALHSHCAGVSGFWRGFGKTKNLGCMCVEWWWCPSSGLIRWRDTSNIMSRLGSTSIPVPP